MWNFLRSPFSNIQDVNSPPKYGESVGNSINSQPGLNIYFSYVPRTNILWHDGTRIRSDVVRYERIAKPNIFVIYSVIARM